MPATVTGPTIPFKLPPLGGPGDPLKWSQPGWRVERRFDPGVLIGNWYEERRDFDVSRRHDFPTTNSSEFPAYPDARPDIVVRRTNLLRRGGQPKERIFLHHDHAYSGNLVSLYDEKYNGRELSESDLPQRRSWDRHRLTWAPEKSDHPLQGAGTRFRLSEQKRRQWAAEAAAGDAGDWSTSTASHFVAPPVNSLVTSHFAAPRTLSSHLLAFNQINRYLSLRGVPARQAPDSFVLPIGADAVACECVGERTGRGEGGGVAGGGGEWQASEEKMGVQVSVKE